jgi:hypothetical protein
MIGLASTIRSPSIFREHPQHPVRRRVLRAEVHSSWTSTLRIGCWCREWGVLDGSPVVGFGPGRGARLHRMVATGTEPETAPAMH